MEWDKISSDPAAVQKWMDEWVFGVKDRAEYWQKLGAQERLKVAPHFSEVVNYGKY
jgi:glutaconate CoA-transferase subunit A